MRPQASFAEMPLKGAWLPAAVLALLVGCVLWAEEVHSLYASLETLLNIPQVQEVMRTARARQAMASLGLDAEGGSWFRTFLYGLPTVPLSLLFTVLSLHLCLMLAGAAAGGLAETARVVGYSASGAALVMIPLVGTLLSLVVVSIQLVSGLTRVHRISALRAIAAMSLPLIAALAFLLLAMGWLLFAR